MVIDELHVVNRELYDTLRYAGAARRQPLLIEISTAGNDKESLGYERYLYAKSVQEGVAEDPELLVYIAEAESNDVWDKPDQWKRANPSLGTTISLDSFRADFNEAKQGTAATRANFCQLRLNIWQNAAHAWLPMDKWDSCAGPVDADALAGRECFAGLDLASTTDTASLSLVFPLPEEAENVETDDGLGKIVMPYAELLWVWVPEEACRRRERENKTRFAGWVAEGWMKTTPGDVIDYDFIRATMNDLQTKYDIREVAIDRWNATHLANQLAGDGFNVVAFGQGYASMSAPAKEFEALVLSGRLRHGGNPVMRWMVGNCSVERDAAGNIKPSKKKSSEKIDGVVATVMALGRATLRPPPSMYDVRGVMVL
jgi:phage terminase large subunit-like protein